MVATTRENGTVEEQFSYDPWGKRRNVADFSTPMPGSYLSSSFTTRGFTFHEQLDGVGLVHMGGRVYMPEIGRFLSPDPVMQFPSATQGLNRYTYVLNNPLSYTDPSGYSIWGFALKIVAYAAVSQIFAAIEGLQIMCDLACSSIVGSIAATAENYAFHSASSGPALEPQRFDLNSDASAGTQLRSSWRRLGNYQAVHGSLVERYLRSIAERLAENLRSASNAGTDNSLLVDEDAVSDNSSRYPWTREAELALRTPNYEEYAIRENERICEANKRRGINGERDVAKALRDAGYEVYDGPITVRVPGFPYPRYPDLAYRWPGEDWTPVEVKVNTSRLLPSQILKDRTIETSGGLVTVGPEDLVGTAEPIPVALVRIMY